MSSLPLLGALLLSGFAAFGQGKGPAPAPPLACGPQGDAEVICGTQSPEDIEATPDGKFMIVAQFVTGPGNGNVPPGRNAIVLFDPAKKSFTKMTAAAEPLKDWGNAACPGAIGDTVAPHGISLAKRSGGKWQLYVVNHGGRESIEMYELKKAGDSWGLTWHGCVVSKDPFNDVAAMANGDFVATHPDAITRAAQAQAKGDTKGKQGGGGNALTSGAPSGWVARWTASKGETELPGTRQGYPNGVLVSSDGRTAYYNAWTAKEVHKYDLRANKEIGMVKLDFMPDNITWTKKGNLLAAGIKGLTGDRALFNVGLIDTGKMTAKNVYDSDGKGALISGVSVGLQFGNSIYIGAFQGDRLVKVPWKE